MSRIQVIAGLCASFDKAAAVAIAALLLTSPAHSQDRKAGDGRNGDRGVAFAGLSLGKAPGIYIGAVIALPDAKLGEGLAVRAVVSGSKYSYNAGPFRIDGHSTAESLAVVYQWSGGWGYANLAAGAVHQFTRLRPDDPGNDNRGSLWDGTISGDGLVNLGTFRVGGLGSYRFRMKEYYGRFEAMRPVGAAISVGAEAIVQGDPSYARELFGGLLVAHPIPRWEARLSGGALRQRSENGAYVALSASRTF